jgi:hypothetical protein
MKLIGIALTYAQVLAEMQLEWPSPQPTRPMTIDDAREGVPIDYFERIPPGMPLHLASEPYHSYVPGEQEWLGAPIEGDPRSRGVLHPFIYALLARTQLKRARR